MIKTTALLGATERIPPSVDICLSQFVWQQVIFTAELAKDGQEGEHDFTEEEIPDTVVIVVMQKTFAGAAQGLILNPIILEPVGQEVTFSCRVFEINET